MKKCLLFIIMLTLMFIAIGKVSAASTYVINVEEDTNYTGPANSSASVSITFASDFAAGTEFGLLFSEEIGVDHFELEFKNPTKVEVIKNKTAVEGETGKYTATIRLKEAVTAGTTLEITTVNVFHKDGAETGTCEVIVAGALIEKTCDDSKPDEGVYYNNDGESITAEQYDLVCLPHVCGTVKVGETVHYFNIKGVEVDTEEEMIASCKCRHDETTDKYYDLDNKEITKEEYEKICLCRIEDGKDGKEYFCKKGESCTAEEYENQCPPDVKTGASIPYVAIIGGALLAGSCCLIASKRNKFKRI